MTSASPATTLPTDPAHIGTWFEEKFNTGDLDAIMELYGSPATYVLKSGDPVRTPAEIRSDLSDFMSLGLPISVVTRAVYRTDDTALVLLDWKIEGRTTTGEDVEVGGCTTDVARQVADGSWRYIIDNPFGTARRSA